MTFTPNSKVRLCSVPFSDYTNVLSFGSNDEARAKLIIRWEELENAQPKVPASTLDILEMTIKNLREQNLQLDEVKSDLKSLKTTVAEIKVFNAPIEHFSIMGY